MGKDSRSNVENSSIDNACETIDSAETSPSARLADQNIDELAKELDAKLGGELSAAIEADTREAGKQAAGKKHEHHYSTILVNKIRYNSYCDETVKASMKVHIKSALITIFSLGIAYPWALCLKYQATAHHKVICGRRMKFIGDPKELFKHWITWWLLSVVTIGFYSFAVHIRMDQWVVANTVFDDTPLVDADEAEATIKACIEQEKQRKSREHLEEAENASA